MPQPLEGQEPKAHEAGRKPTFRGNGLDMTALGALASGALVLLSCLSCGQAAYCLPVLPFLLGLIGLIGAKDSVDPKRTRLWSWLGIGSGAATTNPGSPRRRCLYRASPPVPDPDQRRRLGPGDNTRGHLEAPRAAVRRSRRAERARYGLMHASQAGSDANRRASQPLSAAEIGWISVGLTATGAHEVGNATEDQTARVIARSHVCDGPRLPVTGNAPETTL